MRLICVILQIFFSHWRGRLSLLKYILSGENQWTFYSIDTQVFTVLFYCVLPTSLYLRPTVMAAGVEDGENTEEDGMLKRVAVSVVKRPAIEEEEAARIPLKEMTATAETHICGVGRARISRRRDRIRRWENRHPQMMKSRQETTIKFQNWTTLREKKRMCENKNRNYCI